MAKNNFCLGASINRRGFFNISFPPRKSPGEKYGEDGDCNVSRVGEGGGVQEDDDLFDYERRRYVTGRKDNQIERAKSDVLVNPVNGELVLTDTKRDTRDSSFLMDLIKPKFVRKGRKNYIGLGVTGKEIRGTPPIPRIPTTARPGSEEKVLILCQRMEDGEQLWHPCDVTLNTRANLN